MHPETHGAAAPPSPVLTFPGVDRHTRTPRASAHGVHQPFAGPLSQNMWEKAHSVPSTYDDTFDYGIYDRLYARFGDKQPRGAWYIRAR